MDTLENIFPAEPTERKLMNYEWVPLLSSIKESVRNEWNFSLDRVQAMVLLESNKLICKLSLKLQTVADWSAEKFIEQTASELAAFRQAVLQRYETLAAEDSTDEEKLLPIILDMDFVDNAREVFIKTKTGASGKRATPAKKKAGKTFGKNK